MLFRCCRSWPLPFFPYRVHADFKISAESIQTIKTNYEATKENYLTEKCKPFGTTREQGSWTKKPVADMASDVNDILRLLAFNAYLRPTFHIHTTHFGIVEQCEKTPERLHFSDIATQRRMAAEVLNHAHILLIQVMDVLNNKFELGKDDEMRQAGEDWKISWDTTGWPQGPQEPPPAEASFRPSGVRLFQKYRPLSQAS